MNIALNIKHFHELLKDSDCQLVAISKTKSENEILEAYNAGHKIFGENKVQELTDKHEKLPEDIEWHMVGHLQRNKVKYLVPFVHLIHSVDSIKLIKEINKRGRKINRQIKCLMQVHIAREETKFGFAFEELVEFFQDKKAEEFPFVKILGLMGMATFTDDMDKVRSEFKELRELKDRLKKLNKNRNVEMNELSIGMTNDYKIALEEGSTMIRVGSAIFGERK